MCNYRTFPDGVADGSIHESGSQRTPTGDQFRLRRRCDVILLGQPRQASRVFRSRTVSEGSSSNMAL